MRVARTVIGAFALVLLTATPRVRCGEPPDEAGQRKAEAEKVENKVREALAAAARKAVTRPADAARDLEGFVAWLRFTEALSAERKAELLASLRARIKEYHKAVAAREEAQKARARNLATGPFDAETRRLARRDWLLEVDQSLTEEVDLPGNWREQIERNTKLELTAKEEELVAALNKPVALQFRARPLREVLGKLENNCGITIELDREGLRQAKLTADVPVSLNPQGPTLRASMKKMLGEVGLVLVLRNQGVTVTTPHRASEHITREVYGVQDLLDITGITLDGVKTPTELLQGVAAVVDAVRRMEAESWGTGVGKGRIYFMPCSMCFFIKQSDEVHLVLRGHLK